MRISSRLPILLLASVMVLGCSSLPEVEPVPIQIPEPLSEDVHTRPVVLDRVILDVAKGTVVGEFRTGYSCFPSTAAPQKWSLEVQVLREGEFHREFERILRKYNYRLLEGPASLFERFKYSGDELVVAAKITNVRENRCVARDGFDQSRVHFLGNVRFSVHWEVYSISDDKVVVSFNNEASAEFHEFKDLGEPSYYVTAFGNALKGLLGSSEFRKLSTSSPEKT